MRSIAIALALAALVVLFYVATIVRLGGNVLEPADVMRAAMARLTRQSTIDSQRTDSAADSAAPPRRR